MRLQADPHLPLDLPFLVRQLDSLYRQIAGQLNRLSEGYLEATTNADIAAPTTGDWNRGDFIRNREPAELGSSGSKYVVMGWVCVASGAPGTWVPCRVLTGA